MTEFDAGDRVRDREDPDGRAVVVNVPGDATAAEWYVGNSGTVAMANPGYPDDAQVVVVVWESDLGDSPYADYAGTGALPLKKLHEHGVPQYSFPAPRLERVGERGPQPIRLDELSPSPYHSRQFDAEANREYIAELRERGGPPHPPFVRAHPDGTRELINGHKRVWASAVAGLDAIECRTLWHVDEAKAAYIWVDRHLEGYTPDQRERAITRLRERLSDATVAEIVPDLDAEELDGASLAGDRRGGRHA